VARLKIFTLNEGRADANLGEYFHEADDYQRDGHNAKVGFGNQPCERHDEQ
jgi:hypothetical protein